MYVTVCRQLENGHFAVIEVDVDYDCVDIPAVVRCDDGHECILTDNDYDQVKLEAELEYNLMRKYQ